MRRFHPIAIALSAALLIAGALSAKKPRAQQQKAEKEGPAVRLGEAPESARALKNPYEGDREAMAAGRKLFLRHCAECHGKDGCGDGHAPDMHSSAFRNAPPGTLFWAIRNGRLPKGMPAWSQLPDEQRWQLVTYLKSMK
jgi:mono/diheme cytochrome c family protein